MAESTRWSRIILAGVITGAVLVAFNRGGGEEKPPARAAVVPSRIDIPSLGIKAPLMKLGVKDGAVELPPYEKPQTAGWVKDSAVPGDQGPAVILGHVDTKTAPAVFYKLKDMREGQAIKIVRSDGKVAQYRVDSIERVSKNEFPGRQGLPRGRPPADHLRRQLRLGQARVSRQPHRLRHPRQNLSRPVSRPEAAPSSRPEAVRSDETGVPADPAGQAPQIQPPHSGGEVRSCTRSPAPERFPPSPRHPRHLPHRTDHGGPHAEQGHTDPGTPV